MTNSPKDLDMSDVERDAEAMNEKIIMDLTEHHDPIPLIDVCAMICDSPEYGGDVDEFMRSTTCSELIGMSQSNPNGVHEEIRSALKILFA